MVYLFLIGYRRRYGLFAVELKSEFFEAAIHIPPVYLAIRFDISFLVNVSSDAFNVSRLICINRRLETLCYRHVFAEPSSVIGTVYPSVWKSHINDDLFDGFVGVVRACLDNAYGLEVWFAHALFISLSLSPAF